MIRIGLHNWIYGSVTYLARRRSGIHVASVHNFTRSSHSTHHDNVGVRGILALSLALDPPCTLGGQDGEDDRLGGSDGRHTKRFGLRVIEGCVEQSCNAERVGISQVS